MDSCTDWEVNDIIDCLPFADRNLWDSTRLVAYLLGKAHFKGIKSPSDIVKFKWDDNYTEHVGPTKEEIEATRQRMLQMQKDWNKTVWEDVSIAKLVSGT